MGKISYNLVVYFLMILTIVLGFYFIKPKISVSKPVPKQNFDFSSPRYATWAKLIDGMGDKKAYEKFIELNKNTDPALAHTYAHNFGEVLYKKSGLSGVSVCDTNFAYGCYHSFLGNAIHFQGLAVVNDLNQKCIDNLGSQSLACQHGIGHGVTSYLGYDYDNLKKELDICKNLPANDPIGGCYGGVFMEYNFQTMLLADGRTREYDRLKPLYPCNELDGDFTNSCYYWQTQWWAQVLDGNTKEKFQQITKTCQGLPLSSNQDNCFSGLGNITSQTVNWDVSQARDLCSLSSKTHFRILCTAGAANAFRAEPTVSEKAMEVCSFPDEDTTHECLKQAGLTNL